MMKRKLFFWLEKLKISRAERRAVTVLMILLLGLMFTNAFIEPGSPFDGAYYAELEKEFKQRTALLKQKKKKLMGRYKGIAQYATASDSLPAQNAKAASENSLPGNLININTANANVLDKLPGIGPAYAQNIIEYRRKNGPFTAKRELLKVKGIGDARLAKISALVVLGDINNQNIEAEMSTSETQKQPTTIATVSTEKQKTVINVNTANAKQLETLPGIGPAYAQDIIKYRHENGPFTTIRELLKIKGIGKKRLAKLKPFIKLTGQKPK